jgi:uroporphyrinogen III methyltransferase/synthase
MVTRPDDDPRLRVLLEADGAEVLQCPTIRIVEPADYEPLDAALRGLHAYAWVVFTSRNGVAAVFRRLAALRIPTATLGERRLAVIGPGTAEALREGGLRADVSPAEFRAESLVAALARRNLRGLRVLIPRAEVARDVLPEGLRALGARADVVAAYRTEAAGPAGSLEGMIRTAARRIDAVTFTSPSTVRHFLRLAGPDARHILERALVACIGPVTAAVARESGFRVGAVAATYTLAGLVGVLRDALGPAPLGRPETAADPPHARHREVRHGIS